MAQEMDRLEIVIEAQAKQAASELDHLYQSLEKVSGSLSRISAKNALSGLANAAKSAASGVASGAKQIASHFSLIGSSSSKIRAATSSLKGLLGAVIGFYGIRSLVNLGKDAIELSSNLTEVQNVVENAFGPAGTEAVENFTETSIQRFGLAELAAKRISSRFQAMGKSMGITGQMIADANAHVGKSMDDMYDSSTNDLSAMSLNITKLAADMASFYNVSQEDAAQALSTIWTGQTRPLRQYGLDITQATLAEWAMKHGIDADIQSMTQAQKTMLRYQYVMAQTQMVQGDFNRTAFTWANQTRILRQQFEMLGKTIGDVLINIFRPLITWLNQAMAKVISFAETIANALGKIFGWTIIHTPAATTANDDFVDSLGDIGDAGKDAADGTGKATKALKEYENTVLGFDELNKLNPIPTDTSSPSGGSGSGSPSSSGSTASAAGADFQLVRTDNLIEKYKSDIQTLFGLGNYIGGVLSDEMEKIDWQAVYEKARGFGDGLAQFLNGLISERLFSNLGITIAGAVNTVLNAKDAFLDRFNFTNLGRSLAAGINSFFETYDFGLKAQTFYKSVNGIVEAIRVAVTDIKWESIGNKISDCVRMALRGINWENAYAGADKVGEGLAKFMNGLFKADTFKEVGDAVAKSLNTALRTLSAWARNFEWDSFGKSLGAGLKRFFLKFDWKLAASTFTTLARGIVNAAKEAIDTFAEGNGFYVLGRRINAAIRDIPWAELLKLAGEALWKGFNAAIDFGKGLFSGTPFEQALTDLQTVLNDLAGRIHFDEISKGVGDIVQALAPAVKGFGEGLVDAFSKFGSLGVGILNAIGDVFQDIAKAINSLPEGVVEEFGAALGRVAGALLIIKGVGAAAGVLSSVTSIFGGGAVATTMASGAGGGLGALITGLKSSIPLMSVAFPAATYVVTDTIARMQDRVRGGNGELSDLSTLMDEMAKDFSPALRTELFKLIEGFENNGTKGEQAARKLAEFFNGKNVDPTKIETALRRAQGELNQTDGDVTTVERALALMGSQAGTTAGQVTMTEDDYNNFLGVLRYLQSEGIIPSTEKFEELDAILKQEKGAGTAKTAYERLTGAMVLNKEEAAKVETLMRQNVPSAFNETETKVASVKDAIGKLKDKGIDLTSTGVGGLLGTMLGIGDNAGTAEEKSEKLKSGLWAFAGGVLAKSLLMAVLGTTFGTVGEKADGAGEKIEGISSSADKMVTDTGTALEPLPGLVTTSAEDAVAGFANVFDEDTTATASVKNWVNGGTIETMRSQLDSHSPSKVMESIGGDAIDGFILGIRGKYAETYSAITTMLTEMKRLISAELTNFQNHGAALAQMFKNGLASVSLSDVVSNWRSSLNMSDLNNTLYTAGRNAANSLRNGMKSVSMPRLSYYISAWNSHQLANGGIGYTPVYSPNWYANGGFPNTGELFLANENGPEMVGRMGNRNVVANNMQIAEGIRAAVVEGMMEVAMSGAFGGSNDSTPFVLNATIKTQDDEVLARVVERGQARRNARYNPVAQY